MKITRHVFESFRKQTDTQTDTRHHRGEYSIIASMGGRKKRHSYIAAAHLSRHYKPR